MRILAAAAVVSVLLVGGGLPTSDGSGDGIAVARQPRHQTPEEARESDLKAIAKANGWTLDQARASQRSSAALDTVLEAIVDQAPEILVGSVLSEDPEGAPTIYLKGPSPAFVDELVAASEVPIIVVDDQPYSFDELEERSIRVHQALLALGFRSVATGTDITGGTIPVSLARVSGITAAEAAAIVASLPEDLRASVVLTVVDPPIDALLCDPAVPAPSTSPLAVRVGGPVIPTGCHRARRESWTMPGPAGRLGPAGGRGRPGDRRSGCRRGPRSAVHRPALRHAPRWPRWRHLPGLARRRHALGPGDAPDPVRGPRPGPDLAVER